MTAKISDIQDALMFTGDQIYENEAYISKKKGEVYIISDFMDEEDVELPDDFYESDDYIPLPDKRDLDLGNRLVFRFAEEHMPEYYDKIRNIFRSRGAYLRFKDLLEYTDKLQTWYDYEAEATQQAIKEWCESEDIALEPKTLS